MASAPSEEADTTSKSESSTDVGDKKDTAKAVSMTTPPKIGFQSGSKKSSNDASEAKELEEKEKDETSKMSKMSNSVEKSAAPAGAQVSSGGIGTERKSNDISANKKKKTRARVGRALRESKPKKKPSRSRGSMRFTAKMMTADSGRDLWHPHKPDAVLSKCPPNVAPVTREVLLAILRRENELRLSKSVLDRLEAEVCVIAEESEKCTGHDEHRCERCFEDVSGNVWCASKTLESVQIEAISEVGYDVKNVQTLNYCMEMLRSAQFLYPNDEEVTKSVFYLKHNKARKGELKVGDNMKNIESLLYFDNKSCSLQQMSLKWIVEAASKVGKGQKKGAKGVNEVNEVEGLMQPTVVLAGSMS